MEKLLLEFDFDLFDFSEDTKLNIHREIKYLEKKFKNLFSEKNFDEIIYKLAGIDEHSAFINSLKDFFLEMTRLQIIYKTNPEPTVFLDFVFSDYIFSKECSEMYYALLFQNITRLFLIFATHKPKKIHEIFLAFCKVFSDDEKLLNNILVKTLLQKTKIFFEMQYPEYKISELLEESLIKK
jgi:hypothetical protein